jgi:hypothetical protein
MIEYSAAERYSVDGDGWLCRDGAQLLAGPRAELETFAEILNLSDPPRDRVAPVLRALICGTRGSIFTTGEQLRRLARSAAA